MITGRPSPAALPDRVRRLAQTVAENHAAQGERRQGQEKIERQKTDFSHIYPRLSPALPKRSKQSMMDFLTYKRKLSVIGGKRVSSMSIAAHIERVGATRCRASNSDARLHRAHGEVTTCVAPSPAHAAISLNEWDVLRRGRSTSDIGLGEDYIAGAWTTDNILRLV